MPVQSIGRLSSYPPSDLTLEAVLEPLKARLDTLEDKLDMIMDHLGLDHEEEEEPDPLEEIHEAINRIGKANELRAREEEMNEAKKEIKTEWL